VGERAVDVQVTRLRRKIEADPRAPRYLQTVRGEGYMLTPD
jgi:two-component system phosphate regulon response regulator OmpR